MRKVLLLSAALVLLVGTQVWAARIAARPLTHQEIHDHELAEGTQVGSGLFTVGVGSAVYLEVQVEKGTDVQGEVTWAVTGPGSAVLETSPLGDDIPIYIPRDQNVFDLLGRKLLQPDAKGQWVVTAEIPAMVEEVAADETVTMVAGTISLSETITAGEYMGLSNCSICHSAVVEKWEATGHSTMFTEAIDGLKSSHYNEGCIGCHTVGFDAAEGAVNGGFDDVAKDVGWEFPTTTDAEGEVHPDLKDGNWAAVPADLQNLSNIQCESCHGPGSEHMGNTADNRISVSYDTGNCAQCHDEKPYHSKNQEWNNSLHATTNVNRNSATCNACHSGIGFVELVVEGKDRDDPTLDLNHAQIGCATCHDPHDATNPHQIRKLDDVTLGNGAVVTDGGYGKLCMNCHKGRRNIDTYIDQNLGNPSSHFGPHHGPQTDMLVGENAFEYGADIRRSTHVYAVENACVTCHMPSVPRTVDGEDNPIFTKAGGHTFWPTYDGGTPDDHSDDVNLTEACIGCHGPMESFDIPRDDYDGDGKVEGVQTEVGGLLAILAKALPPVGSPDVEISDDMTANDLQGLFNYEFVLEDRSMGIHNPQYAVGILKASIKDLTGRTISSGGGVRILSGQGKGRGGMTASAGPVGGSREMAGKMVPTEFALAQNAPNPFNPETEIHYSVPEPVTVRIDIYNTLGQRVRTLIEAYHNPGVYAINWNGRDMNGQKVTAGVYIYNMQAGSYVEGRKMTLTP